MQKRQWLWGLAIGSVVVVNMAVSAGASSCRFEKHVEHTLDATAFSAVTLNTLAGSLDVEGNEGTNIVFKATACSDDEERLDHMDVSVTDSIIDGAKTLELTVQIPFRETGYDSDYAYMNVTFSLPRDLTLSIKDSSGDLSVRHAAVTSIDDSSGDITFDAGRTSLAIRDSSGDIEINDNNGNLSITDSSGGITASGIVGNVTIPRDSAGDIRIERVSGEVTIERDSSGSIRIEDVGGLVNIGNDGSGDIAIRQTRGDVKIGSDGSGNVSVSGVEGNFTLLAKGNGDINVRNVTGTVDTPR